MSIQRVLEEFCVRTGWNESSCLFLTGQYIRNQQNNSVYLDHLIERSDGSLPCEAMSEEEIIQHQGWNDTTLLELRLEYIEAQQSHDTFIDYLNEAEEIERQQSMNYI